MFIPGDNDAYPLFDFVVEHHITNARNFGSPDHHNCPYNVRQKSFDPNVISLAFQSQALGKLKQIFVKKVALHDIV